MKLDKDILFLTIKKKWFDKILSGEKTIEYREVKNYYINKFKKDYKKILLQAGYSKQSPRLMADILEIRIETAYIPNELFNNQYFCIYLQNPKLIQPIIPSITSI
jgi:hypothetical protein